MVIPPYIEKGQTVGLISPAGKISSKIITLAENYLNAKGFKSLRGKSVTSSWNQFGGTDQERADDFNVMIENQDVRAIWCTRGGYGSMRILNKLKLSQFKSDPKWLIGFSDITAIHSALQNVFGVMSVHGSMVKNLEKGNFEVSGMETLWRILQGKIPDYNCDSHPLNRKGKCSGVLTGGNLTLLASLKGSMYDFHPKGKILFVEEVGEHFYHLDRLMQGLKISGKLSGLSGMIVGQMTDLTDNSTAFGATAYEIIADAVKDYDFPVLFGFPAGHDMQNEPLLLGAKVQLNVNAQQACLNYLNATY